MKIFSVCHSSITHKQRKILGLCSQIPDIFYLHQSHYKKFCKTIQRRKLFKQSSNGRSMTLILLSIAHLCWKKEHSENFPPSHYFPPPRIFIVLLVHTTFRFRSLIAFILMFPGTRNKSKIISCS